MAGIPSIPKINRFLTSVSASGSVGPEAAYIAAITSAGATVTAPQQAAISTFMSAEIAAGRWDGIKRLYFPVWGLAAANAICMKSLTSGTFVGTIPNPATLGYVTGGGAYLTTNSTLSALGITKESYHVAIHAIDVNESYDALWGVNNFYTFYNDSTFTLQVANDFLLEGSPTFKMLTVGGTNTTRYVKSRNAIGVTTLGTSSATLVQEFSGENFIFMARMLAGGSPNAYNDGRVGVMSLGAALTDAEDTAYTLALKTLWETTTGLTM